jgi:hypothetical protein
MCSFHRESRRLGSAGSFSAKLHGRNLTNLSVKCHKDVMLKRALFFVLITSSTAAALRTQQQGPTIDYSLVFNGAESQQGAFHPPFLEAITTWLSENFDLPVTDQPRVEFIPPAKIAAFRYRGFAQPEASGGDDRTMDDSSGEIEAVYDDATRTIYLPEGWSGTTPAELSVIVHELVHHLQNAAQIKYECPQAREKLAYAAQERWLGMYDRSLSSEFGVDPFKLLVRTRCIG